MSVTLTLPSDTEIAFSRSFNAPSALVYRCFLEPELRKRWMLGPPGWTYTECELDFRPGGRYRNVWRKDDATMEMTIVGVYREIIPLEKVVKEETVEGMPPPNSTVITILFAEHGGQTTVTHIMEFASKEARDNSPAMAMDEDMEVGYQILDTLLQTLATH